MQKKENIYIQWHFTTHGIAYFKHILAAFYAGKCSIKQKKIFADDLSQEEMNEIFDQKKRGFLFDKVYYFTADAKVFNKITTYNIFRRTRFYTDDELIKEKGLVDIWKEVIDKQLSLQEEYLYLKNHYPDRADEIWSYLWRNIQHYPVEEQILWFKQYSNAPQHYKEKVQFINMTKEEKINDLWDYESIAKGMHNQLKKIFARHPEANFIITPVLCSREVQVVWHSLANFNFLPANTRFIAPYDRKDKFPDKRFKLFQIKEIPVNVIEQIRKTFVIYPKSKSPARNLAEKKMQHYMRQGFAILLLGERGTGKTHLAEKYKKENEKFVAVNCATFTDNTLAESILFGYKKGAFTGAFKDTPGVFEQANGGILFLDEIHHLDKLIQAKLMKAIQTDQNNNFIIRRLGDDKEKKVRAILIFASNRTIDQLRKVLLPDFYDRITQLVIELPPLRKTPEDLPEDFRNIWIQMRFQEYYDFDTYVKNDIKFFEWLKKLPLYGNYRDLQRIAIYYKTYLNFDKEIKKMLPTKSAFEFTKSEFEKYASYPEKSENFYLFDLSKNPQELVKQYKKILAEKFIEEYGSAKKVEEKFGITERTLYKWRNQK